jgi:hypothetical protein
VPYTALDPAAAAAAPVTNVGMPKTSVGKTLAGMRSELTRMLMGRDDLTTSQLNTWINDAYLDVCTSLKIDELKGSIALSIIAAQPFYLLPYVVSTTQAVSLVDTSLRDKGMPLSKGDRDSYRDLPDKTDRPEIYFRENDMLVFYPTPDKSYIISLDFRIRPLPLANDTDSPILGQEWHRSIVLRARQFAFDDLLEFDKALPAENSANNTIRRRTDREAGEDEQRVIRSSVPGRGRRWVPPSRREY